MGSYIPEKSLVYAYANLTLGERTSVEKIICLMEVVVFLDYTYVSSN